MRGSPGLAMALAAVTAAFLSFWTYAPATLLVQASGPALESVAPAAAPAPADRMPERGLSRLALQPVLRSGLVPAAESNGALLTAGRPLVDSGGQAAEHRTVALGLDLFSQSDDAAGVGVGVASYSSTSFRLEVPFRTQRDGDRFQGSNCGPAALGMVLEAFGMVQTNADLRLLTHTYQGTVGARTGTALQHMARVGQDFGLTPDGLYEGPEFTRWTIEGVRAELRAGRPVIALVKYRLLPGHEDSRFRADHYIVIHGMDGDDFLYHDPAFESPWEGAARWIDAPWLEEAMRPTFPHQQAVAFGPGRHAALPLLGI